MSEIKVIMSAKDKKKERLGLTTAEAEAVSDILQVQLRIKNVRF